LSSRASEYASKSKIRVHIGTYNVNGRVPSGESLSSFLRISPDDEPDIIALGIQEIVELTPTQIMSADTEKRLIWQREVQAHLGKVYTSSKYVALTSEQLVGAAMLIYVRKENILRIRDIQVSTKKTGLKGMAGNKGGIGIRFDFDDTSICLVTAHLAAGSSNFEERNDDYRTITNGIRFSKGRTIDDHDHIIWFGDFNYRINLDLTNLSYKVMDCIYNQQLAELLIHDQLVQQLREGKAFQGFQEGIINFNPTYKYDNGTDTYDTSEKQRRPAWTGKPHARKVLRASLTPSTYCRSNPLPREGGNESSTFNGT
ncbi:DNase I-like protein, partial [Basidiobolus meristosporus CBS 931.73]